MFRNLSHLILMMAVASSAFAQKQSGQSTSETRPRLRFEVATVKAQKTGGTRGGLEILPGGGLRMTGTTLKDLVAFAWDISESDVSGGPGWVNSALWSIQAKPEHPIDSDTVQTAAPGTSAWDRVRERTQVLLEERFQLTIRVNTREVSGYALVPAKGGTGLKQSPDSGNASTMRSFGRIDSRRGSMGMLAAVLTNMLSHPVANRTGLTGTYDYKLEYAQDSREDRAAFGDPDAVTPSDPRGPSLFTALQEQLGLKLEASRVPLMTIAIQKAQKPDAN